MRGTHVAASQFRRCDGRLVCAPWPRPRQRRRRRRGRGATSRRRRSPRSAACAAALRSPREARQHDQADRLRPLDRREGRSSTAATAAATTCRRRSARAPTARSPCACRSARSPGRSRCDRRAGQVEAHRADRDPASPPPEPNAVLSSVPGLLRPREGRDRHQPHARLCGRAPRRDVLLPHHRRAGRRPHRRAGPCERRRPVKTWTPDSVPSGEVKSISWDGRLGRALGEAGPLLVPAQRRHQRRRRGAHRPGRRRRARRLRPLRQHVPVRGRHNYGGAGPASAPGAPGTAPGPDVSPSAARRWSRPAAGRSSSSSTTRPPATTW